MKNNTIIAKYIYYLIISIQIYKVVEVMHN